MRADLLPHALAPLAHEFRGIDAYQFFNSGGETKNQKRTVLFVSDNTPGIDFQNRWVFGKILDEATDRQKATFPDETIRLSS